MIDEPRTHHYLFAHRVLPSLGLRSIDKLTEVLRQEGASFLEKLWVSVGEDLPPEERLPPARLSVKFADDGGALLIQLPEPQAMAEAYFVAFVIRPRRRFLFFTKNAARCFTLELGLNVESNTPRTVFCEWTGSSHGNMGDGPPPDPDTFLATAVAFVDRGD